jgi:phasin family protein
MDMMKMMADFRLPAMPDMDALATAQRKNLEALTAANRIALEGAQAVAKRHMEILQASMSDMTEVMRGAATSDPKDAATRQAEMMKVSYERAVGNMKELADLIQKSNTEALGMLNKRFTEAMEEVRTLVEKSAKP